MAAERSRRQFTPPKRSKELAWVIWESFQHIHRSFNEALRPHGITGTQLSLLIRIAEQPGLSGADLARRTLTTTQAANLALMALERKQLVERTWADGSGHVLQTVVTETGYQSMLESLDAVHAIEGRMAKNLTKAERDQLRVLLRKYAMSSE